MGLGILSAARALDLEFIPLLSEQYDLVIPASHFETEKIQFLLSIVRGEPFRKEVDSLGGYDTSTMGQVVAELGQPAV